MINDLQLVRGRFPILDQSVNGKPLVYLDSAATTQKPDSVIESVRDYYTQANANVHRGVHELSERATMQYEGARSTLAGFINADPSEVIFTRGTTESINLVASTFGKTIKEGDEIILTILEHHSNIVPWQLLREATGAVIKVVPINEAGELKLNEFEKLLSAKTKIVAVNHISNSLGTINPIKAIAEKAHQAGAVVVVDGAQAMHHASVDVKELGCDFYAISGHKMYGPTGIGALWGKKELLEQMPPYQGGGEMISSVSFEKTKYNVVPHKFEAGTPNIAGAVGLGAAVEFIQSLGVEAIEKYENELLAYATQRLQAVEGLTIIGTAAKKAGVISFKLEGIHPHDIGTIVDQEGVAIRTGHHCTQPLMEHLGVPATARASLGIYNRKEDFDSLAKALEQVRKVFA